MKRAATLRSTWSCGGSVRRTDTHPWIEESRRLYGVRDVTATPGFWRRNYEEGWTLEPRYWPSLQRWRLTWRGPDGKLCDLLSPGFVWVSRTTAEVHKRMMDLLYGGSA